jgi:hypothetical protein
MFRASVLAVLVFLIAGVALFMVWPHLLQLVGGAPAPGQYPLEDPRPQWPGVARTVPYRPSETMGSDAAISADVTGPKVACATGLFPPCLATPA